MGLLGKILWYGLVFIAFDFLLLELGIYDHLATLEILNWLFSSLLNSIISGIESIVNSIIDGLNPLVIEGGIL